MATRPMSSLIQQLRSSALLDQYAIVPDGQLLDSFVKGCGEEALEVLVRRHAPMVWGVCQRVLGNHHDAEDAFQATFLVFVRKAASIFPRAKVSNWLHGVARQTALRTRETRAKQKTRERDVTEMPEPARMDQDLQSKLDEELSRLPEKYRTVIVLCDLEGKTKKEAARQLNLPEGTVASRVATARAMLAKNLARCRPGGAVSIVTLGALLAPHTAFTAVPAALMKTTLQAAGLAAAGQNAFGVASPMAVVLAEAVLRAMFVSRCKVLATSVVALLVSTCLIVSAVQTGRGAREPPAPQADLPVTQEVKLFQSTNKRNRPSDKMDMPKSPSREIVTRWRAAGADVGWMRLEKYGYLDFLSQEKSIAGTVPAFRFVSGNKEVLATLPDPRVPFGLELGRMTDGDLSGLAGLKNLKMLSLVGVNVTGAGLNVLAGLKSLHSLNLWGCFTHQRTDLDLRGLARLKSLALLDLSFVQVADAGLQNLAGLDNLRSLDLRRTQVTDAALGKLAGLKNLQMLNLYEIQVTDESVRALAGLKNLQWLDLGDTKVSDAGLRSLAALENLQWLSLFQTQVVDAGLAELARLQNLQMLNLSETRVTDAGLKELIGLANLQALYLLDTPVTDAGLQELARLKSLQYLNVSGTNVTAAGIATLQKQLPTCSIICAQGAF